MDATEIEMNAPPTVNPVSYHGGGGMDCGDEGSAIGATIGHMEG